MEIKLQLGDIVKINKPHLENNDFSRRGGHGKIGKIIDIKGQCYVVATSMEIFTCDLKNLIIYDGEVSKSVKNIIAYKKGFNYYFR
jgi:ribosomal protein L21E